MWRLPGPGERWTIEFVQQGPLMEDQPTPATQGSRDVVQSVTPLVTMEYLAADQSLGTQWAHLEKKKIARLIMEHQVVLFTPLILQ